MLFDLIGALTSLLSTYYFIRLNNRAWPIGMVATILNGWLYWHKGIYADMVLEIIYFISMCYGWSKWYGQSPINETSITTPLNRLAPKHWVSLLFVLGASFTLIYYLLNTITHSTVAVMDATTTSMSLIAQWLMCHKIIFTWILWFITDALYAVMYLSKNLPYHSLLMIVYTGLAISGYLVWTKKSKAMLTTNSDYSPQCTSI